MILDFLVLYILPIIYTAKIRKIFELAKFVTALLLDV